MSKGLTTFTSPGSGAPWAFDYINAYNFQWNPSTVHVLGSGEQLFFAKYLLERAISVFKWQMPETWVEEYVYYCIYCWGYISVINTNIYGVIPQGCSLSGYGVMYQPTEAYISNPLLRGTLNPKIGKQCEIIRLQGNYTGIMDIINYYSCLMALATQACEVNFLNSHLAFAFLTSSKTGEAAMKKMYDKIASGEPAVFYDKGYIDKDGNPLWECFNRDVKSTYIANEILDDLRKIENMFDTHIGIPNTNLAKKERMITDEVNQNNVETYTLTSKWLENLQAGCKKVNNMFGINLSVDWRFKPQIN